MVSYPLRTKVRSLPSLPTVSSCYTSTTPKYTPRDGGPGDDGPTREKTRCSGPSPRVLPHSSSPFRVHMTLGRLQSTKKIRTSSVSVLVWGSDHNDTGEFSLLLTPSFFIPLNTFRGTHSSLPRLNLSDWQKGDSLGDGKLYRVPYTNEYSFEKVYC